MKIVVTMASFFILFSCTNSVVDMSSSLSNNNASLELVGGTPVSRLTNVLLRLRLYHTDILVNKLAIYDSADCTTIGSKLGEIDNLIGSTLPVSGLIEKQHTFYYKPLYEKPELNQTAGCLSSGLTYVVDLTPPGAPTISIDPQFRLSPSPVVTLTVAGCETSVTGATSLLLQQGAGIPAVDSPDWKSCTATATFTVTGSRGNKSISAYSKDFAGNISPIPNTTSFDYSSAEINFNNGAGPDATVGAEVSSTVLDAIVGGINIVSYKFKIGKKVEIDCADISGYSAEIPWYVNMNRDLRSATQSYADGTEVKICVIGKDSSLNWQSVKEATSYTWTLNPAIRDLSVMISPRLLSFDNQPPSQIVQYPFVSFGTGSYFNYTGGNGLSTLGLLQGLNITTNSSPSGINNATLFLSLPGPFNQTYNLMVRTQQQLCTGGGWRRMFLTRGAYVGTFPSGIIGADAVCASEANGLSAGVWKALLSAAASSGLSRLTSSTNYCDARDSTLLFNGSSFVASFYQFVDGSPTNGGGSSVTFGLNEDWRYVAEAPRSRNSNPIFYGGTSDCNCNNWGANPAASSCGGGTGQVISGLLNHSTNSSDAFTQSRLPGGATINSNFESCTTPQHIVCFDSSP